MKEKDKIFIIFKLYSYLFNEMIQKKIFNWSQNKYFIKLFHRPSRLWIFVLSVILNYLIILRICSIDLYLN